MTTTYAYCDIVKHERNEDGDLVVTGRATGPDVDLDRQICDPDWLAKAMPEWYSTGANVREMHTSIAAGRGDQLVQNGDGWDLRSLVVDPVSARKVEKQVLRGYSIGISNPQVIKDTRAPGGRIVGGQIVEVSLVDRPANPSCQLVMAKSLKPGPQTAQQIDAERRLVKVEELHDRTGEPLAAVKALAVDIGKADDADIATAQQAITIIAGLIQSEAQCLADGMASEACDIDLLLNAVRALEWFITRETQEDSPMAVTVGLSAAADTEKLVAAAKAAGQKAEAAVRAGGSVQITQGSTVEKSVTAPPADPAPQTLAPDATKAVEGEQKNDLAELVKVLTAKVDALSTKVANTPAPGGPVLTRTTEDTTKAAVREDLLSKAAAAEHTADALQHDPRAAAGYRSLAKRFRDQANPTS